METGREACLRLVVEQLGPTAAGQELGLHEVRRLDDLRTLVPIRDPEQHAQDVESRMGFGLGDGPGSELSTLSGDARERDHVCSVWRALFEDKNPARVALLRGRSFEPAVDATMVDDLKGLGGELLRIDRLDDPPSVLDRLEKFDPELLVVPSALTCRKLESVHRAPLERRLKALTTILAEYDLQRPIRTRVPLHSAGWIGRSGRRGLATLRPPNHAVVLAVGTQIIELLPYSNPEEDGRRAYASKTILPEHAMIGQRYELVVTSPMGFVRLRTNEHVRVVGFDAPCPVAPFPRPRVVRLAPAPADVSLEGCTVGGSWLTASIRQAFRPEDPALVVAEIGADPLSIPTGGISVHTGSMRLHDAFKETELAWLARTGAHRVRRRRPRGLLVRLEVQGYVSTELSNVVGERIDASLRSRSAAYEYLRGRQELERPRVVIVPAGTHRAEEDRRITDLMGPVWAPEVRVV